MDIFGERTLCLLSPAISSITASTFLPGSTSRGSRSRTRMGTSMERNFYTFILFSLALVILILSPSASANQPCTPMFSLLSEGDEYESDDNSGIGKPQTVVTVREEASYKLTCTLSRYHSIKWTINGREVTHKNRDDWNIEIQSGEEMDGSLFTELRVNNASQQHHAGEYKCTPLCSGGGAGSNVGFTVKINKAINVTIADSKTALDANGVTIYRKYVARENKVAIVCKAHVPNVQMTWFRIKDEKRTEENMAEVCQGVDVELAAKMKKPPEHCTVTLGGGSEASSITLRFNRARKEGIEALKTISDFRRYVCRAEQGNQDGHAYVDLLERVSADRKFDKGLRSVSVTEGDELQIYCDVHGVDKKEFETGEAKLSWTKDKLLLSMDDIKPATKIAEHGPEERGKPYRVGFQYDMAEPSHRGEYKCQVQRTAIDSELVNGLQKNVTFTYYVRVKDKLGALWPFLGICGEVVILCTIILIYEKRRNKTELDESDTDGSPDQ